MSIRTKRNSNIELLRVIAMFMIIVLHYLNQGGILENATFGETNYFIAWIAESFSYVSVNIYVLISGWMLCTNTAPIKIGKILRLIFQVVFYSVGIYLIACAFQISRFSVESLLFGYLFPVIHGEYWFATVYVVLYLISPFLNKFVSALTRKEHKLLLCILGIAFSAIPTIFFFSGNSIGVNDGYSLVWFVFLYLLASYLRKYEIHFSQKWLLPIVLVSCLLPFGMKCGQQLLLANELWDWYKYTSLPITVGSVALFMFFVQLPCKHNRVWNFLGATTFGVFLIHTQYIMRDTLLWNCWIQPLFHYQQSPAIFFVHLLLSASLIFVGCAIVDWIREWLFNRIAPLYPLLVKKFQNRFSNPFS